LKVLALPDIAFLSHFVLFFSKGSFYGDWTVSPPSNNISFLPLLFEQFSEWKRTLPLANPS